MLYFYALIAVVIGTFIAGVFIGINELKKDKEKKEKAKTEVIKTKIIDTSHTATVTSKAKTGSSVGRAVIGGAIAGPAGAMIGAGTAKRKVTVDEHHTTTFMVFYQDGTRNHDTVENGTELYHIYMEKLDIE